MRIPAFALTCILAWSGVARAAWLPGGTPIDTEAGQHTGPRVVPDGLGGAYVVWTLSNTQVHAQHLTADGDAATGWAANGQEIAVSGLGHTLLGAGPDGSNGLIVGMNEADAGRAARLQADGSAVPGWSPSGVVFFAPSNTPGHVSALDYFASDYASGGWFFTDSLWTTCFEPGNCFSGGEGFVGHIGGTGSVDGSWLLMAAEYGTFFQGGSTRPGGLIAAVLSGDGREAQTARLSPTLHESWTKFSDSQNVNVYGSADDGAGGALTVVEDNLSDYPDTPLHLMRTDATGAVPVGWPADGVPLPLPKNSFLKTTVVDDGSGGILIGWVNLVGAGNELRVLRMTNAGVPATGWPAEGVLLNGAPGAHAELRLAADGAGGVFAAWTDKRTDAGDIYAARVNSDGTLDAAFATNGSIIAAGPGQQSGPDLSTVSPGHAILAWMDKRDGVHTVIYAQQLPSPFVLDVPGHPAPRLSLAGFMPNPARGAIRVSFRLSEQADATLDVFDLLGRRVAGQELAALPAGDHAVPLDGAGKLPNGLYLIRLRAGNHELVARGMIAR